ncbi:Ig-like domain-containing protein, partial [Denitromonas iodatirespirans]
TAPTLPAWLTLTDNGDGTATLSGTPTNAEVGNHAVSLQVSDGSLTATQNFTLTVSHTNSVPVITSDGGGAAAVLGRIDPTVTVTTVTATDADPADVLSFQILGGNDASSFTLDAASGELRFATLPGGLPPADANGDSVYEVIVGVSDGRGGTDAQTLSVTLNVSVPPELPPAWVPPAPPVEDATPDPTPADPSAEAAETDVPQEDVGARATEASTPVGEALASVPPTERIAAVVKAPSPVRVEVAAVNLVSAQMPVFDVRMLDIDVNTLATGADGDSSPDQAVVLSPELQRQIEAAGDSARLTVAIVGVSGTVITVGVVWWVTRVGALVATLVASLPAWRSIDPLPILRQVKDPAAMALEEDDAPDSGPRRDVVVEDGRA